MYHTRILFFRIRPIILFAICILPFQSKAEGILSDNITEGNVGGYIISRTEKVDQIYGGGFSLYANVYPLLKEYTGRKFQSGLFGTWMHPYNNPHPTKKMYTDIEGGLGWWRGTRYATETPKFGMCGIQLNFRCWGGGPGAGKGRDWSTNNGKYAAAQLSPWVLFPPDGLNIRQGACNELFGYGYLPLPLTEGKGTTGGKNIATGNQCWTLFLNTRNFKGPIAFFLPFYWSETYLLDSDFSGLCLDQRPAAANKAFQQETQHINTYEATDSKGNRYIRMAPTQFPIDREGNTEFMHQLVVYKKSALWSRVEDWFHDGPVADTKIDTEQAVMQKFKEGAYARWKLWKKNPVPGYIPAPLNITEFMDFSHTDSTTLRMQWKGKLGKIAQTPYGKSVLILPEYYKWERNSPNDSIGRWIAVSPQDVPEETRLQEISFKNKDKREKQAYLTPEEPESCWKRPGPVAGPFKALLGDGSTVTYYWYRFADQPALLNADMSDTEREEMQRRVELLHKHWTKEKEYLPEPANGGTLTDIDPALLVTPPEGYEIGYVPIVTKQYLED